MLLKKEAKYRIKFIQEHHYNKSAQKIFDRAKEENQTTYKQLYQSVRNGATYLFMVEIALAGCARAMANMSVHAKCLAAGLYGLADAQRRAYEDEVKRKNANQFMG